MANESHVLPGPQLCPVSALTERGDSRHAERLRRRLLLRTACKYVFTSARRLGRFLTFSVSFTTF